MSSINIFCIPKIDNELKKFWYIVKINERLYLIYPLKNFIIIKNLKDDNRYEIRKNNNKHIICKKEILFTKLMIFMFKILIIINVKNIEINIL